MHHVLLVSENRILLKELYGFLCDKPDYQIHIVPFSANAYEAFVEVRADIVVLDVDVLMPYKSILQQLEQSQWNYNAVVLIDFADRLVERENITYLEKSHLSARLLEKAFSPAEGAQARPRGGVSIAVNLDGGMEFFSYPDIYYILLAKSVGPVPNISKEETMRRIRAQTRHIGEIEIMSAGSNDYICSVRKSKLRQGFLFSEFGRAILSMLGKSYAVIYSENIKWSELESVYSGIIGISPYCYYLKGESVDVQRLRERISPVDMRGLKELLGKLVGYIFDGREAPLQECLSEIYFHKLKPHLDRPAHGYVRWFLGLCIQMLSFPVAPDCTPLPSGHPSAELEYEDALARLKQLAAATAGLKLPHAVHEAIFTLLTCFHQELSLYDVADKLNLNKIYIGRIFHQWTGVTVLEFLQIIRMQSAYYMLKETDLKIREIALLAGYRDSGYFSRVFKKRAGYSPEDYRNEFQPERKT
ncbi:MAG: helix-turn-helix transcriptional regulator, partial [Clostridiales Family XIII bacterium]|nr:helix-turn-helix transcriptional regulator [Clostridiales Family XIII bacterium]